MSCVKLKSSSGRPLSREMMSSKRENVYGLHTHTIDFRYGRVSNCYDSKYTFSSNIQYPDREYYCENFIDL